MTLPRCQECAPKRPPWRWVNTPGESAASKRANSPVLVSHEELIRQVATNRKIDALRKCVLFMPRKGRRFDMSESSNTKPLTAAELLIQGCERPWEVAVKPFRVAPNVYYVGNSWVGGYLIRTDNGLILIDTTMHHQVYLIFESIRELGFNPKDIKLILITHAHYDHVGAVRPIAEYTGAKVYMAREDEFYLTERPELIHTNGLTFANFQIDEYYDDNKPITLGQIAIHTEHTPGHTPGTTSIFFEDRDDDGKVYRCGLHGGVGLATVSDRYYEQTGLPSSLRDDYLSGLLKLRSRELDIALASHPKHIHMLDKIGEDRTAFRPFCDPSTWGEFIDERIRLLKEMTGAN